VVVPLTPMTANTSFHRATVVGLSGKQTDLLRKEIGHIALVRTMTPERALRFRGDGSEVVVMTRFIGHKHERHLRSVSGCPVVVLRHGGVDAVVRALQSFLNLDLRAA